MTLNRENELARFLYAILKQLDTRSINWDLIAQDPVLLTPIRSGHAARMRYHRYRKTVDNRPTTKRNALEENSNSNSNDINHKKKSKKTSRIKAKRPIFKREEERDTVIKHEFTPDLPYLGSPYPGDVLGDLKSELLTPCSDMVNSMLLPIAGQAEMQLFDTEGCNPADLSLSGTELERAQIMGISNFESAMVFQDFDGSDVNSANPTSGWDDRFKEEHQF